MDSLELDSTTRVFNTKLVSRNLNTKSLVSSGGESTAEAGTTSSIPKNLPFSLLEWVSKYNSCLRRSFISNFDSFVRSEMSSSLNWILSSNSDAFFSTLFAAGLVHVHLNEILSPRY